MKLGIKIISNNLIARTYARFPLLTQILWCLVATIIYYSPAAATNLIKDKSIIIFLPVFIFLFLVLLYNLILVIIKFQKSWKQIIILTLATYNSIMIYGVIRVIINFIVYRDV